MRSYDNAQLKRKLQPALSELEAIGFLVPEPTTKRILRRSHGHWQIVVQRQQKGISQPIPDGPVESVVTELTGDVPSSIAAGLVRQYSADKIREKDRTARLAG